MFVDGRSVAHSGSERGPCGGTAVRETQPARHRMLESGYLGDRVVGRAAISSQRLRVDAWAVRPLVTRCCPQPRCHNSRRDPVSGTAMGELLLLRSAVTGILAGRPAQLDVRCG